MISSVPTDEFKRQHALAGNVLHNASSDKLCSSITSLATTVCNATFSRITFVDHEQHYSKSQCGDPICDETHEFSVSQHIMCSEQAVFIVEDATSDLRFAKYPMVVEQGIVFFAGVTIFSSDGQKLGTLCVYDKKTRDFDSNQQSALVQLAGQVESVLDQACLTTRLGEAEELLKATQLQLEQQNAKRDEFVANVAHDLKAPMVKIARVSELLIDDYNTVLDEEGRNWLSVLSNAAQSAGDQIDQLLSTEQGVDSS